MKNIGYKTQSMALCPQDIPEVEKIEPVRTSQDDLLDLIFAIDPITGFPSGSISQYLSDKTSDEVRDFIEKNILVDLPSQTDSALPEAVNMAFRELEPDFQLNLMRKSFESLGEYEIRIQKYFNDIQKQETDKKIADRVKVLVDEIQKNYGSKKEFS